LFPPSPSKNFLKANSLRGKFPPQGSFLEDDMWVFHMEDIGAREKCSENNGILEEVSVTRLNNNLH